MHLRCKISLIDVLETLFLCKKFLPFIFPNFQFLSFVASVISCNMSVTIKSLYFESGSKRLEPGGKIQWVVWHVFDRQMVVFHPMLTIYSPKIVSTIYDGVLSLHAVKI